MIVLLAVMSVFAFVVIQLPPGDYCLFFTSCAADEKRGGDHGWGRVLLKKKNKDIRVMLRHE